MPEEFWMVYELKHHEHNNAEEPAGQKSKISGNEWVNTNLTIAELQEKTYIHANLLSVLVPRNFQPGF